MAARDRYRTGIDVSTMSSMAKLAFQLNELRTSFNDRTQPDFTDGEDSASSFVLFRFKWLLFEDTFFEMRVITLSLNGTDAE